MHPGTDPLWQVKLLAALRTGDIAHIQPFLSDIKPSKKAGTLDAEGPTANDTAALVLHFAIRGATYETVELILSNKYVSPNLAHPPGSSFTALHLAASLGRADVLRLLIEQDGADDTITDDHGQSPADVAKDQRTLDTIRGLQDDFRRQYTVLLSQYVASPPTSDISSSPAAPELLAILRAPRVKLLDLSQLDSSSGTTLLHEAARRRDQLLVEAAVHAGADVFVRDRQGKGVLDSDRGKDGERIRAFLRQYLNQDTSLVGSATNDPPSYKGYLSKYANVAKGYNTRWFVLKDDMLSYYRTREDEGLAIRGAVSVRTARVKTMPGDKLRFEVHANAPSNQGTQSALSSTAQKWYMKANHPGEVARWTQVLTRSIDYYQQKDRATLPPPNSDGESINSHRESSRHTKSIRSSVDMLRGWSGRSSHSANRSRADVDMVPSKAESTSSRAPPQNSAPQPEDDARSRSSGESDASHIPHGDQFSFQLHTLEMEVDLARQLLDEMVLPPSAAARAVEIKSTLQRSILTIKSAIDQYGTMARDRENWYANRVQEEADARRMWEDNVVTLANQSEKVERELVRSVQINKGQRKVLKSLLGPSLQDDPTTPRATADTATTATRPSMDKSTPPLAPSILERPNAPAQIALPEAVHPSVRSPLAEQLNALGEDELLQGDESDTDEFFDAIESGVISNVPSAIRPQPETPLPPSLDIELYRGYKNLRDRLPIGSDNRPPVSLWAVLKGSIGKDLTKISFPVFFNEPTSMLQRMAEDMEFSECLDAAAQEQDPHKRIAYVAAFAMSNYSSTIGRIAKPFNPMLGETFEYCRLDKQYRYISEQVSHHPPMSACWAESPQWNYYGEVDAKNKFMGKSFEIRPTGVAHAEIKLPVAWAPHYPPAQGEPERDQKRVIEHYSWKKVTTNVSGFIVGQPTIDHYGDMTITNHRTGDTCLLTFKPRGWRAKDSFEISGVIQDAAGQVTWEIAGRWNSQLVARRAGSDAGNLLPDAQVSAKQLSANEYMLLWKNTEKPAAPFNLTPFAITLNDCPADTLLPCLPPTDCRIRPDQRAFEMGRYERANELKSTQEDFQRATRRKRELGELPPHKPRWFSEAVDEDSGERMWVPSKREGRIEYWAERERVFRLGGREHVQWDAVDEIFIQEE
ncbi:oxysterol binding protein [Ceratobasidium sp. AG-Ba]|nr:oxysterol binding protein [Ceratobasidium sp. AG-Ba]